MLILISILYSILTSINIFERNGLSTTVFKIQPLYSNIWGTIYHAEIAQCDSTPNITGDGSIINPDIASELRWIAISQDMLDCEYRYSLLSDKSSNLFKGKIKYGDSIWIESSNKKINGWWIAHDTKNKRYRNTIDFLQTKGDANLYDNNKLWSGKFIDIKIYSKENAKLICYNN
jgi:hypothetical protein